MYQLGRSAVQRVDGNNCYDDVHYCWFGDRYTVCEKPVGKHWKFVTSDLVNCPICIELEKQADARMATIKPPANCFRELKPGEVLRQSSHCDFSDGTGCNVVALYFSYATSSYHEEQEDYPHDEPK